MFAVQGLLSFKARYLRVSKRPVNRSFQKKLFKTSFDFHLKQSGRPEGFLARVTRVAACHVSSEAGRYRALLMMAIAFYRFPYISFRLLHDVIIKLSFDCGITAKTGIS